MKIDNQSRFGNSNNKRATILIPNGYKFGVDDYIIFLVGISAVKSRVDEISVKNQANNVKRTLKFQFINFLNF